MRCKKIFGAFFMLSILAFLLPSGLLADEGANAWHAGIGNGLEWRIENRGIDDAQALVIRLAEGCKSGTMKEFSKSSVLPWGNEITSVHLPEGLTRVGNYAFYRCDKIKGTLYIPASIDSLGISSFRFTRITGIHFAPHSALKVIGDECFRSCYNLKGVLTIPQSVAYIGDYAFYHAGYDGNGTDAGSMHLRFEEGSQLRSIGMYAFSECRRLKGTLAIPENVTDIREQAFSNTGIQTLHIPKQSTLKLIYPSAFFKCDQLTGEVTIPSSVKAIESYAFAGSGITGVQWMERPKNGVPCVISYAAFKDCVRLEGVFRVPDGVSAIKKGAFQNTGITRFVFEGAAPKTIEEESFQGVTADAFYPAAYGSTYDDKKRNYGGVITWMPYGVHIGFDTQTSEIANPQDMITGEDGTLKLLPEVSRTGYTFGGWYRDEQCTGDAITTDTVFDSDTVLYGKWTKIRHTVIFDAQGGNVFPNSAQTNELGCLDMLPIPTKAGYGFAGWYREKNGAGAVVSKTTVFDTPVTIYAQWIEDDAVEPAPPKKHPHHSPQTLPENPRTDSDKADDKQWQPIIFFIDRAIYQQGDRYMAMDAAPFIYENRTMLPVRYVGEALGMRVDYDEAFRTATLSSAHRRISIHIDKADMRLNGTPVLLAVKPANVNGRIYLPIGLLADALGMTRDNPSSGQDITYDKDARSVRITGTMAEASF